MAKIDKVGEEIKYDILRAINDIDAADAIIGMTKDEMKLLKITESLTRFEALIKGRVLLLMNEVEKDGWDFNRFINTFSEMVRRAVEKTKRK